MYFYVPETLQSDFDDCLTYLGENLTINYDEATPTSLTGMVTQMKFKSNLKGLLDETMDLYISLSDTIKKGDYVTRSNGDIYICSWTVYQDVNCYYTQIQKCSYNFTFKRWHSEYWTSEGIEATPAYYETIDTKYGYITRIISSSVDTRVGQVGIQGSQKLFVGIKYDSDSADIQLLDEFSYFNQVYEISDIDMTQINQDTSSGLLLIYGQIKSGGTNET